MSSFVIKLDGIEVSTLGLRPTVLNINTYRRDQTGFRVAQIVTGVVCLIFCWTDPDTYTGIWTGIPFILTGAAFIVFEINANPIWLCAALVMNFLSIVLGTTGIFLFCLSWRYRGIQYVVLFANTFGLYCSGQTMLTQRCGLPSQKVLQDAKQPLLDSEVAPYDEKLLNA